MNTTLTDIFTVIDIKPSKAAYRGKCEMPGCDELKQNHTGGAIPTFKPWCHKHHAMGDWFRKLEKAAYRAENPGLYDRLFEDEQEPEEPILAVGGESLLPNGDRDRLQLIDTKNQRNKSFIYFLPTIDGEYIKIGKADSYSRIQHLNRIYRFDLENSFVLEIDISKNKNRVIHVEKAFHAVFEEFKKHHPLKETGHTEFFDSSIKEQITEAAQYMFPKAAYKKLFK